MNKVLKSSLRKENRWNEETKKVNFDSDEKLNVKGTEEDTKEMQRDFK